MTVHERFAAHARDWGVSVEEIRTTDTSRLGFGTIGNHAVVLKVIRHEDSEEWRCGELLDAFGGNGMVQPIAHSPGAVLLRRLVPGYDLASVCLAGRDDEATAIIASLIQRMPAIVVSPAGGWPVERMYPDFAKYRPAVRLSPSGVRPIEQARFDWCASSRTSPLHGDRITTTCCLTPGGLVPSITWPVGELEFEIGACLRLR